MTDKYTQEAREAAEHLVRALGVNCCNVCSCDGGIKVWCACHRKQIASALEARDIQVLRECAEIAKKEEGCVDCITSFNIAKAIEDTIPKEGK